MAAWQLAVVACLRECQNLCPALRRVSGSLQRVWRNLFLGAESGIVSKGSPGDSWWAGQLLCVPCPGGRGRPSRPHPCLQSRRGRHHRCWRCFLRGLSLRYDQGDSKTFPPDCLSIPWFQKVKGQETCQAAHFQGQWKSFIKLLQNITWLFWSRREDWRAFRRMKKCWETP